MSSSFRRDADDLPPRAPERLAKTNDSPKGELHTKRSWRLRKLTLIVRNVLSVLDAEDIVFFVALIFLAAGIHHLYPQWTYFVIGLILLLSVRPLRKWF